MTNIDQIPMVGIGLFCTSVALVFLLSFIPVYAQSEQTTITDIENNPVAQDILRKIEQTKQWIAELEQREYEKIEAQKFLEDRRAVALESLNRDLLAWEELWAEYSPRNSFAKFVSDKPDGVKGVFWDQFEFKEQKVNAGRAALKKVLADGGSLTQARNAYITAAETKRIELIEANAKFNVQHNLAYYNQQILFHPNGTLDLELTGEQLREYYRDYRTNPAYLAANPNDVLSWEDLGKTSSNTECREGYVLIYRNHAEDYVCVTERTAEMWQRLGMGYPVSNGVPVIPEEITIQMNQDRIAEKISGINLKIQQIHDAHDTQSKDMERRYDHMLIKMEEEKKDEEELVINKYKSDEIDRDNFSAQITDIREKYDTVEKNMIIEKFQTMEIMEKTLKDNLKTLISKYEYDSEIQIIWSAEHKTYNAIIEA